jgi:hypothetical protein
MARSSSTSNVVTITKSRSRAAAAPPPVPNTRQRRAAKAAMAKAVDEDKPGGRRTPANYKMGRPKGGTNRRPPRPADCKYMTLREFGEYFRMSYSTARARAKKMTRIKWGNIVLVEVAEAEGLMRSYIVPPTPAPNPAAAGSEVTPLRRPKRGESRATT